ncbi:hypothetical protein HZA57_04590 [Candidatus Poribacteria bacterium]|nr:hypothetical protein [Candidatus Poribacteria bacterium]
MNEEQAKAKKRQIGELMREAAAAFGRGASRDLGPALPMIRAAVDIAQELDDKTPLSICESNLASMNAVCGHEAEALDHIERAIRIAVENDVPASMRNHAFTKFVEISIRLHCEPERALTYSRALIQSAVDDEQNYQRFLGALYNLAIVSFELCGQPEWALAILSWISDEASPHDHPTAQQARRFHRKFCRIFEEEERASALSHIEANREELLRLATLEYLPEFAPVPPSPSLD